MSGAVYEHTYLCHFGPLWLTLWFYLRINNCSRQADRWPVCGEVEDVVERPLGCARDMRLYEWIKRKYATVLQFNLSLPQRRFRQYASFWSMKQQRRLLAKWVQLKRSLVEGFTRDPLYNTTCLKVLAYSKSTLNRIVSSVFSSLFPRLLNMKDVKVFIPKAKALKIDSVTQHVHW